MLEVLDIFATILVIFSFVSIPTLALWFVGGLA